MSISDRDLAKTRSLKVIKGIEEKWREARWVEEIAIDIIALWSCGPAYLATYQDAHENWNDPFLIEPNHPPVELRTYALIQAAQKLGWFEYFDTLERLRKGWWEKISSSFKNEYEALRQTDLIESCLDAALAYCEYIRIPRLEFDHLDQVRQSFLKDEDYSNGIDLIVRAWLVHHDKGEAYYHEWEERTVKKLIEEITL